LVREISSDHDDFFFKKVSTIVIAHFLFYFKYCIASWLRVQIFKYQMQALQSFNMVDLVECWLHLVECWLHLVECWLHLVECWLQAKTYIYTYIYVYVCLYINATVIAQSKFNSELTFVNCYKMFLATVFGKDLENVRDVDAKVYIWIYMNVYI
jgi:hypothetical protein